MNGYDIDHYEPWSHYRDDKSNAAPIGDTRGAIYGLELEIAEICDYCGIEFLEELIEEGSVETSDSGRAAIQLEYEAQSDVDFELVFNADSRDALLARVANVGGLRPYIHQHRETSCHIHSNRYYVEDVLGLSDMDFFRAAEAIAPFIYAISGRSYSAWREWTPAAIDIQTYWLDRFAEVDGVQSRSRSGGTRYELVNLENEDTIELRGFSNYYGFDSELIGYYLDVVADLIPAIAQAMQGKSYARDYPLVVELLQDFIMEHDGLHDYGFPLDQFLSVDVEAHRRQQRQKSFEDAIAQYRMVSRALSTARSYAENGDYIAAARDVLAILDAYPQSFQLDAVHTTAAIMDDINALDDKNAAAFKNAVWRV